MSPKTDTEVLIGGKVFTLSGYNIDLLLLRRGEGFFQQRCAVAALIDSDHVMGEENVTVPVPPFVSITGAFCSVGITISGVVSGVGSSSSPELQL